MNLAHKILLTGLAIIIAAASALGGEFTLDLTAESRFFANRSPYAGPSQMAGSFSALGEYYHVWPGRSEQFAATLFARVDLYDSHRSHFDARELFWQKQFANWELNIGLRRVFWGVTESVHLVDVINQTDLVENIDGEDKLGQPMIQAVWLSRWGTFSAFWMPYFRERTFAGTHGRLRPAFKVNTDLVVYESGAGQWHQDWALHWMHTLGLADIGLSYFSGTDRQPQFVPILTSDGQVELAPRYNQLNQLGLDLLLVYGGWLWKLEAVSRESRNQHSTAFVAGFEYTLVGLLGSQWDLGLLGEYLYDDRGAMATPFEHDVFVGGRLALNDIGGTAILVGMIVDTYHGSKVTIVEASRRLTDWWSVEAEVRAFSDGNRGELMYDLRQDDFLQIRITRHI
jgi:hypothetical protein